MQKTRTKNKNQGKPIKPFWHPGAVVGTVHTSRGLQLAAKLTPGVCDAVEIRLDVVAPKPEELSSISLPIILTPRCASEGGATDWSPDERLAQVLPLLDQASAVDMELANAQKMRHLLQACEANQIPVIFSFHDFQKTPSASKLQRLHAVAGDYGAEVFKVATMLRNPEDFSTLLKFVGTSRSPQVSVMGMGSLGRVSRLALAVAGSVLNYGWLHRPQVSGQWPAKQLGVLIAESKS